MGICLFAKPLLSNGFCIFAYLEVIARQLVYILQYIVVLSFHLRLGVESSRFRSDFPTKFRMYLWFLPCMLL
jgi:hypothetical protein